MLDEIRARNVGLIADAVLTPGHGLTVITGETGTGKTLILGALRLVSGGAASKGTIGPHEDTAEVAARFLGLGDEELVVRRVVTSTRSRAYLNGAPATATQVAEIVGPRVSIVGQHDQHTLSRSDGIRGLIDGTFTSEQRLTLTRYTDAYRDLRSIEAEMETIGSDRRGLERELEMTRFQIAEITDAAFSVGDEEELRARLDRLRHAEEISTEIAAASEALGETGVDRAVGSALVSLDRVLRLDPGVADLRDRLASAMANVHEVSVDIARYGDGIDANPQALAIEEQRLAELSALKRKYGDTITDISAFAKSASQRAETIGGLLLAAETLGVRHADATDALTQAATELTKLRTGIAADVSTITIDHLKDLGFDKPVVSIRPCVDSCLRCCRRRRCGLRRDRCGRRRHHSTCNGRETGITCTHPPGDLCDTPSPGCSSRRSSLQRGERGHDCDDHRS